MTNEARTPVVIIDAANVVGSRPDGWWRDRRGANERLRDALCAVSDRGIDALAGPLRVILVVEGQARGIPSIPTVEVVSATASGDDTIVELVTARFGSDAWVVTADRELRERVHSAGAQVLGPGSLRDERNGLTSN